MRSKAGWKRCDSPAIWRRSRRSEEEKRVASCWGEWSFHRIGSN